MKRFQGKLFGAALGFSFGGPIGAIIGAAVGHFIDASGKNCFTQYSQNSEKELHFITSLILLLSGTARADGNVSSAEVDTIKKFFSEQLGYGKIELLLIEKIIYESFQKPVVLAETCAAISAKTSYEERLFLVQLNYQVAVSDGALSLREEEFIGRAAEALGIYQYDYISIRNSFTKNRGEAGGGPSAIEDPYRTLGLFPGCSNDEVHGAYRNLANKYHPDKVTHLGEEFIELATKRFTQINDAYEMIKKERALK